MLSAYFKLKTKTDEFKNNIETVTEKCKDKKVLLYGTNKGFIKLNKKYNFTKRLNITAIVNEKQKAGVISRFCNIKSISKYDVTKEEFDVIVVTNENAQQTVSSIEAEYNICQDKIFSLFVDTIKEERPNLNFLCRHKFDRTFPKLVKKMRNKKVVLYGAGIILEVINKYFDLSKLNIIAVADKKYGLINNEETFLGYKTINPAEIKDLNPDCVIISTKFYIGIFEYMHFDLLRGSRIKVIPLIKKGFFTLLKELIES